MGCDALQSVLHPQSTLVAVSICIKVCYWEWQYLAACIPSEPCASPPPWQTLTITSGAGPAYCDGTKLAAAQAEGFCTQGRRVAASGATSCR